MRIKLPDDARALAVQQLDTLSGIAKGLTRSTDGIAVFSEQERIASQRSLDEITQARGDPRMMNLRDTIFTALRDIVELWSTDAEVANVRWRFLRFKESVRCDLGVLIGAQ